MNSGQWTTLGIVLLAAGILLFIISTVWMMIWMNRFNKEYGENNG